MVPKLDEGGGPETTKILTMALVSSSLFFLNEEGGVKHSNEAKQNCETTHHVFFS